jgi:hypothetical protein
MEAKMTKFFDSVGNFFTGGDNIPWCDRDIIAVCAPHLTLRLTNLPPVNSVPAM